MNQHGYSCPNCGSDEEIEIAVMVFVRLCANGTEDVGGDLEWDNDSTARCAECDWIGTVGDLKEEQEANP